MFCSKCGAQNTGNERFCSNCGVQLQNVEQPINNQQINSGNYKLTITRPKEYVASLIKFKIFIDNNVVGTIKNGETVVLDVSAGNHTISLNNTINQNINISCDTYADAVVIAGNKFGLTNIRDNNGTIIQLDDLYATNMDKITKSARGPLLLSIGCIVLTFILLFTVRMVVSPWIYGMSIGYTIINFSSIKRVKNALGDKYKSLVTLNVASIIISVIGIIISMFLIIG